MRAPTSARLAANHTQERAATISDTTTHGNTRHTRAAALVVTYADNHHNTAFGGTTCCPNASATAGQLQHDICARTPRHTALAAPTRRHAGRVAPLPRQPDEATHPAHSCILHDITALTLHTIIELRARTRH